MTEETPSHADLVKALKAKATERWQRDVNATSGNAPPVQTYGEWQAAVALETTLFALQKLERAGEALRTGIAVHNRLDKDAPARRDNVDGPVVRAFYEELHNARMALHKPEAADHPDDPPLGSAIIDDPVGELLAIALFREDRGGARYDGQARYGAKRAPVSGLGLEAQSWIDCPEADRQIYRDMARGKVPLP